MTATWEENERGEVEHSESYTADGDMKILQELADRGLLWLVNRVLHPFGYALGAEVLVDGGKVQKLVLYKTDDFEGIIFGDGEEGLTGRRKLLNWLTRGMKR